MKTYRVVLVEPLAEPTPHGVHGHRVEELLPVEVEYLGLAAALSVAGGAMLDAQVKRRMLLKPLESGTTVAIHEKNDHEPYLRWEWSGESWEPSVPKENGR